MYAVVGYLDAETEMIFENLWKTLSQQDISDYGKEDPYRRAHITLASYENPEKELFMDQLDDFYREKPGIEVTLGILGTFVQSGTLFFAPNLSQALLDFHRNHHEFFHAFNDASDSLYLPGNWVPHCTIASRLDSNKMTKTFDYCSKFRPIQTKITEIALLEFIYERNQFIGAPAIHTKKLI